LIRYRVGDTGRLPVSEKVCSCGRTLPVIESIEGRVDDLIYTTHGRKIGRLDPVFKTNLPVHEAQIIQETLSRIRVKIVPTSNYTSEAGASIIQRLKARLGEIEIVLEEVAEIPREPNGKFRAVLSHISRINQKVIE